MEFMMIGLNHRDVNSKLKFLVLGTADPDSLRFGLTLNIFYKINKWGLVRFITFLLFDQSTQPNLSIPVIYSAQLDPTQPNPLPALDIRVIKV